MVAPPSCPPNAWYCAAWDHEVGQDEAIVEAQPRAIEENPGYVFYNLNLDAGSMWARRIIDRMVAAERAPHGMAAE